MRSLRTRYRTPLLKEEFRIKDLRESESHEGFREYVESANFEILDLASDSVLDARLAHYTHTSLAFVTTPATTIRWNRNAASQARALVIFTRRGELAVNPTHLAIRRGSNVALVPPGTIPLEISFTAKSNELIYISAPAEVVPEAAANVVARTAPAIPWRKIAPLYAFVHALCSSSGPASDEPDVLAACAEAIVKSSVRTILSGLSSHESVVMRVDAFIAEYHTSPHLSVSSLAQHFGMATRTLQAAYAEEGTTVTASLREARRRTAIALRESHPRMPQQQVANLAGFSSASAMYRAFSIETDSSDSVSVSA